MQAILPFELRVWRTRVWRACREKVRRAYEAGSAEPLPLGIRPVLARTAGSLPLAPALAARGIPALITGVGVPSGAIHAPNERFRLDHFELGLAAARELFIALCRAAVVLEDVQRQEGRDECVRQVDHL